MCTTACVWESEDNCGKGFCLPAKWGLELELSSSELRATLPPPLWFKSQFISGPEPGWDRSSTLNVKLRRWRIWVQRGEGRSSSPHSPYFVAQGESPRAPIVFPVYHPGCLRSPFSIMLLTSSSVSPSSTHSLSEGLSWTSFLEKLIGNVLQDFPVHWTSKKEVICHFIPWPTRECLGSMLV